MTDFLTTLENAIANRLEPLKDYGLDVVNSPHRCSGGRAKAIALFYFTDQSATDEGSCNQTREINLQVEIKACDQRSHHVAYPYVIALDVMLHGWTPKAGKNGQITFSSVRYVPARTKNGVEWIYDMTFKLKVSHCMPRDVENAIAEIFDL